MSLRWMQVELAPDGLDPELPRFRELFYYKLFILKAMASNLLAMASNLGSLSS